MISTLKSGGRAAVLAAVLGAASITALPAPAMAQSPQFSFELDLGAGSVEFGTKKRDRDRDFDIEVCLNDRQVRRGLRDEGFRNIDIVRDLRRNRVEVIASYHKRFYLLRVDRCSGDVRVLERLRRNNRFGIRLEF